MKNLMIPTPSIAGASTSGLRHVDLNPVVIDIDSHDDSVSFDDNGAKSAIEAHFRSADMLAMHNTRTGYPVKNAQDLANAKAMVLAYQILANGDNGLADFNAKEIALKDLANNWVEMRTYSDPQAVLAKLSESPDKLLQLTNSKKPLNSQIRELGLDGTNNQIKHIFSRVIEKLNERFTATNSRTTIEDVKAAIDACAHEFNQLSNHLTELSNARGPTETAEFHSTEQLYNNLRQADTTATPAAVIQLDNGNKCVVLLLDRDREKFAFYNPMEDANGITPNQILSRQEVTDELMRAGLAPGAKINASVMRKEAGSSTVAVHPKSVFETMMDIAYHVDSVSDAEKGQLRQKLLQDYPALADHPAAVGQAVSNSDQGNAAVSDAIVSIEEGTPPAVNNAPSAAIGESPPDIEKLMERLDKCGVNTPQKYENLQKFWQHVDLQGGARAGAYGYLASFFPANMFSWGVSMANFKPPAGGGGDGVTTPSAANGGTVSPDSTTSLESITTAASAAASPKVPPAVPGAVGVGTVALVRGPAELSTAKSRGVRAYTSTTNSHNYAARRLDGRNGALDGFKGLFTERTNTKSLASIFNMQFVRNQAPWLAFTATQVAGQAISEGSKYVKPFVGLSNAVTGFPAAAAAGSLIRLTTEDKLNLTGLDGQNGVPDILDPEIYKGFIDFDKDEDISHLKASHAAYKFLNNSESRFAGDGVKETVKKLKDAYKEQFTNLGDNYSAMAGRVLVLSAQYAMRSAAGYIKEGEAAKKITCRPF